MRKLLLIAVFAAAPLFGQIADNSFLIEEAYNQEPGVVQHIAFAQFATHGGDWVSSFTQEWPAGSLQHQLSYTLSSSHADGSTALDGFALNYRYQLVGDGDARLAISPRLSLVHGDDATGVQIMLPVSYLVTPRFATHWNAGASLTPANDERAWTAAQSMVWLANPRFNALVETVWTREDGPGGSRDTTLVISPGIRWAYDFPGGLQIVPGIAVPFTVNGDESRGVIAYLSFEHPFGRR
jgi:hypothetical protein